MPENSWTRKGESVLSDSQGATKMTKMDYCHKTGANEHGAMGADHRLWIKNRQATDSAYEVITAYQVQKPTLPNFVSCLFYFYYDF